MRSKITHHIPLHGCHNKFLIPDNYYIHKLHGSEPLAFECVITRMHNDTLTHKSRKNNIQIRALHLIHRSDSRYISVFGGRLGPISHHG